ncbi:MAG: hypothetical protein ABSG60_15965 [Terracidiphilus sp.]
MGADRLSFGPLNAAGTNPYDQQALILDTENNILEISGASRTRAVLFSRLAIVENALALTAITTAQTLLSLALNAGALNVQNRRVRVRGRMVYSTTSSNVATITLALTLGGVTLCSISTTATNTAASVNLPIDFEFELLVATTGATAAIMSYGHVKADLGTATTAAITEFLDSNIGSSDTITVGTNPTAWDTITVNGTLVTFIVHGGTAVGNQVVLGTTAALTATALYTFLAASTDTNIAKATWTNPSSTVVLGVANVAGFTPWATTSVPAKITFSTPTVNLLTAETLAVTMATGTAAVPSAQLLDAQIEVVG